MGFWIGRDKLSTSKKGLLHHIEIYVSDLNRSSEFWAWFLGHLGYEQYQKWESGVSFKLGDTYLVFVQANPKHLDQPYHRCKVGLNHLAFHADSLEQLDLLRQELLSRQVPLLYADRHFNRSDSIKNALYFEDPDRIKVEVVVGFSD